MHRSLQFAGLSLEMPKRSLRSADNSDTNPPQKKCGRRIAKLADREEIQAIFVACIAKDAQLVGWIDVAITYHLQSEPFVLIGGLVVQDGLRGLGIGKCLCEEAEAWTRAKGISIVRRDLAEHSPRRAPFLSARWIHRDQNFQGIRKAPRLN